MKITRPALPAVAVLTAALALTGCSVKADPAGTAPAAQTQAQSQDQGAQALTLVDGWAKATEDPMTGVFGTLTNGTDADIHLVEVRSDVAGMSELHVTVDDGAGGRIMKKADDGFVIPAGGEHVLEPGGDHLMLMKLHGPIATGEDVEVLLVDAEGGEYAVTVTARAFTGAEEHYAPGEGHDTGDGEMGDGGMGDHGESTKQP